MRGGPVTSLGSALLISVLPLTTSAEPIPKPPLSVIDWLDSPSPLMPLPRAPDIREPAVAITGAAPQITTRRLEQGVPERVGLVPATVTGMQPDIWAGSAAGALTRLIGDLPDLDLPAGNALLFTLLLAEATPPQGGARAQERLTGARVEKLMMLGATDPALALVEQAGPTSSAALFALWTDLSLLTGTEDTPCDVLARAPHLSRDLGIRIFCAARGGHWQDAALLLGSARALSLLPRETLDVLDRFLNPDLFEDAAPLPIPRSMDPLTFRLFETIGEPLPTGPLPRAFAVADLRDIAGWKSQLEAAERLTRAGALPDNRLLGLYTDRKPAASGGIWDRVHAVQQFDVALNTGSAEAIEKTLPTAWREMRGAGIEVSFAAAFYDRLSQIDLHGAAAQVQFKMGLLSPAYEETAARDVSIGPLTPLLRAVARGEAPASAPGGALPHAIHDAFTAPAPRAEWIEMARTGRLGEALLGTLGALHDGARGDSRALRDALGTLRGLGLEDTARRVSLQILLLEHAE